MSPGNFAAEQLSIHRVARGQEDGTGSPIERLSDRELEVMELVGQGQSSQQIAASLHLSSKEDNREPPAPHQREARVQDGRRDGALRNVDWHNEKSERFSQEERSGPNTRSSRRQLYFTTPNSARRFLAYAESLVPLSAGAFSAPKLTVCRRLPSRTIGDQGLAHGEGTLFSQTPIVLRRAALVGEAGNNDRIFCATHEIGDFTQFATVLSADVVAVELEVDGRRSDVDRLHYCP